MSHQISLKIPYTSENFPIAYGVGSGTLTTSWDDILWAALTVGRPNIAYVFQHGKASLYEAIFRLSLIRTAIEQDTSGYLKRTAAFTKLDPTEKGAVSYFLGMTLCKLFAAKLLDIPWLLHLDVFRELLNPTLLGRSRPDLVGEDICGGWHVFECKGRSSSQPSNRDKIKAIIQAQSISAVDDVRCSLQVGTFAFFKSNVLHFYWSDPELKDHSLKLVSPMQKWRYYYEPVLALDSNTENSIREVVSNSLQVFSKIHPVILELLSSNHWDKARTSAIGLRNEFKELGFQPDGLRIKAGESWQHSLKNRPG